MSLLGMNALWVKEMIWEMIGFIPFANTLATILYTTLQMLIGL